MITAALFCYAYVVEASPSHPELMTSRPPGTCKLLIVLFAKTSEPDCPAVELPAAAVIEPAGSKALFVA